MKNQDMSANSKPVGPMMNNWVSQHLAEPLEIRTSIFHLVLGVFLGLFFLILGVGAIVNLFNEFGLSPLPLLICLGGIGLVLLFYFMWQRGKKMILKTISPAGVFTRGGQRFDWSHYIGVKYLLMRTRRGGPIKVWTVELVFENGKASFGPGGMKEADRIMEFIYSLPGEHIETDR